MTLERSSDARNYSGINTITADAARCNQPFAESRRRTLNDRRIYAADLLHAADADVRMFLARWADPDNTDPALSAKIAAAKAARADAQRALDEAEQELSAALTAERIEAEDAAR